MKSSLQTAVGEVPTLCCGQRCVFLAFEVLGVLDPLLRFIHAVLCVTTSPSLSTGPRA